MMLTLTHVAWDNTEVIKFHACQRQLYSRQQHDFHQLNLRSYIYQSQIELCFVFVPSLQPLPSTNHSFGNLNIDCQSA